MHRTWDAGFRDTIIRFDEIQAQVDRAVEFDTGADQAAVGAIISWRATASTYAARQPARPLVGRVYCFEFVFRTCQ